MDHWLSFRMHPSQAISHQPSIGMGQPLCIGKIKAFKWYDEAMYRVVQNYWYCEGKYGCGVCLTPPKSYMSFFFHKNNFFQHFTSWKFHKYCAKFWKIMSVKWIILHPYFRNDNFSKDRNYSFLIEILFTKLS